MRRDLITLTEEGQTLGILPDTIHGAVEIGGLAVGREDVCVEEISHAPLDRIVLADCQGKEGNATLV